MMRSTFQEWIKFVKEYIGTIKLNWQTPQDAAIWYAEVSNNADRFDRLFLHLWFSATQSRKRNHFDIRFRILE